MSNRRQFLKGSDLAAMSEHAAHLSGKHEIYSSETKGAFPDIRIVTHEGKLGNLYADLVRDRIVTINFMSIKREKQLPISARMAEVAAALGPRLGHEVHMISITADPDHDTVERLNAFHASLGGYKGWTFVHTTNHLASLVAQRFYRHGREISLGGRTDIVQYGNAKVGLWGSFPWDIRPEDAAERLSWVAPRPLPEGGPKRAGPRRIGDAGPSWNNRLA